MKKILSSIPAVAAVIAMTATFSACSSDDEQKSSNATLIINASRGDYGDNDNNSTRAITLSDNKEQITTSWAVSDNVTVFNKDWTKIGTLNPDGTSTFAESWKTKLTGNISPTNLKVSDELNFLYPRDTWDYTGQDGTFSKISSTYDYATAKVYVTDIVADNNNNKVYGTTAAFGDAQQAIVRFTLLESDGTAFPVPDNGELSITTAKNELVTKCNLDGTAKEKGGALVIKKTGTSDNVFYVAIRNDYDGADQYTLTIKDASKNLYTYTKPDLNLQRGHYKKVKVKMRLYDNTWTERNEYVNESGEEIWE